MRVCCAQCGEELMGAVNRCWQCGRHFDRHLDPSRLPPVRRAPVVLHARGNREVAGGEPLEAQLVAEAAPAVHPQKSSLSQLGKRRGSPFASEPQPGAIVAHWTTPTRSPIAPRYQLRDQAAVGGAVGSVVLGILGLLGSWLTVVGALLLGLFGLAMGVWGLYSTRRSVALAGIVLCCIALAISSYYGAVQLHLQIYNVEPFAEEVPENVMEGY